MIGSAHLCQQNNDSTPEFSVAYLESSQDCVYHRDRDLIALAMASDIAHLLTTLAWKRPGDQSRPTRKGGK